MKTKKEYAFEALKEMRELLKSPIRWTKRHAAVDKFGNGVDFDSSHAARWCLIGAAAKVCKTYYDNSTHNNSVHNMVIRDLESLLPQKYNKSLPQYNDDPAIIHSDILDLIDGAIKIK